MTLLDRDADAVDHLRATAARLGADKVECIQADAAAWLDRAAGPFDIVFLDPPFQSNLLEPCLERLNRRRLLNPGALIYMEAEKHLDMSQLPSAWRIRREKTSGQVRYLLLEAASAPVPEHNNNA